jgi:hypothetical protein
MKLKVAITVLLLQHCCCGSERNTESCSALPPKLTFARNDSLWTYNPSEASLSLNFDNYLFFSRDWCSITTASETEGYYPYFKVDLISTERRRGSGAQTLKSRGAIRNRCRRLRKGSYIQNSAILHVNQTRHSFNYVQGMYYMRISACKSPNQCDNDDLICSESLTLAADFGKNTNVCEYDFPSNVSADIIDTSSSRFPRFYGLVSRQYSNDSEENWFCDINLRAIIPLCTAHQSYDTVTVTAVEVNKGEDECSFADYHNFDHNHTDVATLQPCDNSTGCYEAASNSTTVRGPMALLEHDIRKISRNSSYCLFFRLNNPHCRGDAGCVFYTQTLTCDLLRTSGFGLTSLVTQPVFIGVVSGTLILSLALLTWTVIQCSKKKPGTPLITSGGSNGPHNVKKPPPRSLTEDDLEHISRLPSQEIVLVYFPDTQRFKELNRKMRDWLITLDVNDVKDIYDEKCSEDVLKNPEAWVRNTLAGPEKRIILVCSRLAYECLVCVKRGVSSPKFVETDPHFGLLTRTIQYLDREMRGNYRNLICVRYEDLKICSRNYSSEAFNIVPGTEYVLPQHLEDVYRWIHPIDPKPECWDENKPEVRQLLDSIRQYRHHDDNIFTVQFSDDPVGPSPDACSPITNDIHNQNSTFNQRTL